MPSRVRRARFTLLELVITLAIFSALAGLGAWGGKSMIPRWQTRSMAYRVKADLERCRAIAIQYGNYCRLKIITYDNLLGIRSKKVGMSMFNGYSYNERCMLSLGVVDADVAVGDVLTLVWGEPNGGSGKTSTERHKQKEIRVRVSPTPYAAEAREHYADSWRTKKAS